MFFKKGVLGNFAKFTGKPLCQSLFFNKVRPATLLKKRLIKKDTLAQVFSFEFCEISKNMFFKRKRPVAACLLFIIFLILKTDLQFNQKPRKINLKILQLAQLPGQYRLFGIPFHVQTNCSCFVEHT